jgi:hypothetical protein
LTGSHFFLHVLVGLGLLCWGALGCGVPPPCRAVALLECSGIYWHMVDLRVVVLLFPLLYLVREEAPGCNRVTPVWFVLRLATGVLLVAAPPGAYSSAHRLPGLATRGRARDRADQGRLIIRTFMGSRSRACGPLRLRRRRVAASALGRLRS